MERKLPLPALWCLLTVLIGSGWWPPGVEEARAGTHLIQGRRVTVSYDTPDQWQRFARQLRPDAVTRTLNGVLLGGSSSNDPKAAGFLDDLFRRVQLLLDMPLPQLRVKIQLVSNQKSLDAICVRLTGKPVGAPAFYFKKTNTIYIQTARLTRGMVAHEMAHCIIDHYFVVQPPPKVAELLCQYVDKEVSAGRF